MGLIINADAISTFYSEGIDTTYILKVFGNVSDLCESYASWISLDFTGRVDPNLPENITGAAVEYWNQSYVAKLTAESNVKIQNAILSLYDLVVSLFDTTASAEDSRTLVVDQLSETLTNYSVTEVLQFLADLQP